jgi:hypothetical protein
MKKVSSACGGCCKVVSSTLTLPSSHILHCIREPLIETWFFDYYQKLPINSSDYKDQIVVAKIRSSDVSKVAPNQLTPTNYCNRTGEQLNKIGGFQLSNSYDNVGAIL